MKEYNIFTKEIVVKKTFRVKAENIKEAIKKFHELHYNCGRELGEDCCQNKWEVESILPVSKENYIY